MDSLKAHNLSEGVRALNEQHLIHQYLGQILSFDAISLAYSIYNFLCLVSGFGNTYPNITLEVEYSHAYCLLKLENDKQN